MAFVLQIVLVVLVLGGAIAYIGNYVGRYIGKKRLTLFNLRPRYTAIAITVISGVLIALSTAGVLLMISQDARTALLGLDRLKQEISEKTKELNAANESLQKLDRTLSQLEKNLEAVKQESAQLQKVKQRLSKEVTLAREGEVLFRKGEVISLSLIQAGPGKGKIDAGLKKIIASANSYLNGLGTRSTVNVFPDDLDTAIYTLVGESRLFVVKLVADRNAVWGEGIPAHFELNENRLVYRAGDEIVGGDIPAGLSAPQIEQEVMKILRASHQAAKDAGVLPDPSGSVGRISYSQISDVARKVKALNKKVSLRVVAQKDIYAIGPLEVEFKVGNK